MTHGPKQDDQVMESFEKELQITRKQLHFLKEIRFLLESTISLDEIFTTVVNKATNIMQAESMTLYLVEESGDLVSRVIENNIVAEISLNPGQGLAGWTARTGKPVRVDDVKKDSRFDPSWDKKNGFQTRSIICHPIFGRTGNVIGVAEILNKEIGSFVDEDQDLLGLLCDQLAMTIENARMMVDLVHKNSAITKSKIGLERRNRELNLLLDIERLLARSDDLDSFVTVVLRRVIEITGSEVGVLYRSDAEGADSRICSLDGLPCRVIRVESGAGFTGWVAAKGQDLNIAEPAGDPRFRASLEQRIGINLQNIAVVHLPFPKEKTTRGSLAMANKNRSGGYDETDMALLRLVAVQISEAVEHLTDRETRERDRRLATVGRLLAGVLHDLKSPITVVSGYAELMASKVEGDAGKEYMTQINAALNRITKMAEEIILFSKGERDLLIHNCSLEKFIDGFISQIKPILDSNNIELVVHKRTSGTVRIDEAKMLRAFHNIVLNAVEAMDEGGRFIIEVDHIGREVIFSFTDTGPGIPDSIQGSIFQSFVTLGKDNGTGLGLAVVREIVEGHGGKINFTTLKGGGSTFLIIIPTKVRD